MESRIKNATSVSSIMQFMTHDSLRLYKKKGSRMPIHRLIDYEKSEKHNPYQKGAVFVSHSKEALTQGKGFVVTSYETLQEKHQNLTHWTPNTYRGGTYYNFKNRIIKGHDRENLKQINVISFDIDTKNVDLYGLYLGCDELKLPRPNLLLETPRGYQGFFVLETPFFITNKKDYRSLRVAERLSDNIRAALNKIVPVDRNCVPFGFYRIPKENNILHFYDQPANTTQLLLWSKEYEKQEQRNHLHVVYSQHASGSKLSSSDWYHALIRATDIKPGYHSASRNNALLTLALANYASGRPYEEAYDELDEFNSRLTQPLSKNEFERTLKSAYSGKYKGVKRSYAEGLLELWSNGTALFQGREGWYKFKKPREERVRSHYDEREEDILNYLARHTSPESPFMEGSIETLARLFGMASSTLKEVFKQSTKLVKRTRGRGRGAVTTVASRSTLLRHSLLFRKRRNRQAQTLLEEYLSPDVATRYPPVKIVVNTEFLTYEEELLFRSGASPLIKMTN